MTGYMLLTLGVVRIGSWSAQNRVPTGNMLQVSLMNKNANPFDVLAPIDQSLLLSLGTRSTSSMIMVLEIS